MPSYTLAITGIEKIHHQDSNTDILDVAVNILCDGEVVAERKLGFDPTIGKEELETELQKYCDNYALEQAQAIANAAQDAIDKNVGELAEELKDATFTSTPAEEQDGGDNAE